MRRREVIALLGGVAVGTPLLPAPLSAQPAGKRYRIGYLSGGTAVSRRPLLAAFRSGMEALGYREGENYVFEARLAEGRFERLPALARELLSLDPDLLLVSTTPGNLAAKAATSTVPIVMVGVADPLGVGLITSLARPGGNITGVTNIGAELAGKRLELLKEIVPAARRVAVLINTGDANAPLQMKSAQAAAQDLGVELAPILEVGRREDLEPAFAAAAGGGAAGALRMIDPLVSALRRPTVALAAEHRLPMIHPFRGAVEIGGLISFGTSLSDQYRQTATFVHKILNGAKPADLPVERPTKFELAVNLNAARALGLSMPTSILLRADEVIE